DTSRNPLFDVMLSVLNVGTPTLEIPGLKLSGYDTESNVSKFDLSLNTVETEKNLLLNFNYCTKLFKPTTVERFITYFKKIVTEVIEQWNKKISTIEIVTDTEKEQVIYRFNDTGRDYPKDKTIHRLFEDQVERTPGRIAVVSDVSITYRELNRQSDNLARHLNRNGAGPGAIVAIKIDRSLEMVIGIYGILKAGGAYLPIAP
ncbi:MAG: AMP-binding protein, partial [bacterium]|nr:AMP-binding protein [bacterium]